MKGMIMDWYEDWMESGLCRSAEYDPDLWFPEKGQNGKKARDICKECPVSATCLEYAITNKIKVGIWGGTNQTDRSKSDFEPTTSPRPSLVGYRGPKHTPHIGAKNGRLVSV